MSAATLHEMLIGRIDVRVDERTAHGALAHVAAGRLIGGNANGNTLDILTNRGVVRTVRLSGRHVVAYTPITETEVAA